MRRLVSLVSAALVAVACSKGKEPDQAPSPSAVPARAAVNGDSVQGTILEQIAVSPYVYLRLKTPAGEVWAAVNEASLAVGAQVTVHNVLLMEKFESKTLKRTFDRIYFGTLEAPIAPAAAMAGNSATQPAIGTPAADDAHVGRVEKAPGAGARTIGELWTQQNGLSGKTVSIRGVVVKYNAGVMGKNWIHLQDGSGDAIKGTHDITATSMDAAATGDTVTITGTVRLNRDFGAGYSYPLIVEDARVLVK